MSLSLRRVCHVLEDESRSVFPSTARPQQTQRDSPKSAKESGARVHLQSDEGVYEKGGLGGFEAAAAVQACVCVCVCVWWRWWWR